ncbi:response regulator transcription factor [Nonomuraea rosea]|uniref:Response regulator transcription factor n=1 Tax=Nonomuraea rosea TaxID=638574 RepID=A0ABP7AA86_9ACTN
MEEPITIVLVEDHPMTLAGLSQLLQDEPGLQVVGTAETGAQGVRLAEELIPDLMLVDLNLPDISGVEVTRQVKAVYPHLHILIFTAFDDDSSVLHAIEAGAGGYVLKSATPAQIVRSLKAVAGGDAVFGPQLAHRLVDLFTAKARTATPFEGLTGREREVLELVARGWANQAISRHLGITDKTVRNFVSNVLIKLQAATRAEAIVRAREAGLGSGRTVPGRPGTSAS